MKEHYWSLCPMCGPVMICGKCGNNCCNGGYGTLEDGTECNECPIAYDIQNLGYNNYTDEELIEKYKLDETSS